MNAKNRIVFLDYLRVIACFMVMLVHACECFYLNGNGEFAIASAGDAFWATLIDSACRAAVPLFVMASSFLLLPITRPTGEFFRRRLVRVAIPFAVWCALYVWRNGGNPVDCLFNFPMATGGHLWFVPMLLGLYLLMPIISPWVERLSAKGLRGWIWVWLFTTTFPFLRKLCECWCGAPSFGAVPFLYGECPWNVFGTFHYVSGFIGYVLLGFYIRKFLPELSWRRTLSAAVPLWVVGFAIVWLGFYGRIPALGAYPIVKPYATAVDMEMSWQFCSTGVAMTVFAYFLVLRKFNWSGACYRWVIRPLSDVSYGIYLAHIMVLMAIAAPLCNALPTPLAILLIALGSFSVSAAVCLIVRRIPKFGKWVVG